MSEIPFNRPPFFQESIAHCHEAFASGKFSGDGSYSLKCHRLIEKATGTIQSFLTTSCTAALEMSALLCDLKPEDEVIVPSFTFVTSVSPFTMRGARAVFVDIRPDTLNIDETAVEEAVSARTKAIIVTHYAGVACEMEAILELGRRRGLMIVEDAAHAVGSGYKGRPCGAIGDVGCFSFHETKNISCGEGGALLVNRRRLVKRAEIIREKGTNRSEFFRGEVDKYTWVDVGSSYLLSDILASLLYHQLRNLDLINARRLSFWRRYYDFFAPYEARGLVRRPSVPPECEHNAHMFYLLWPDVETRTRFIRHLKIKGISVVSHYVPLHSSPMGVRSGRAVGSMKNTIKAADTLLRFPLYYDLGEGDFERILEETGNFLETL